MSSWSPNEGINISVIYTQTRASISLPFGTFRTTTALQQRASAFSTLCFLLLFNLRQMRPFLFVSAVFSLCSAVAFVVANRTETIGNQDSRILYSDGWKIVSLRILRVCVTIIIHLCGPPRYPLFSAMEVHWPTSTLVLEKRALRCTVSTTAYYHCREC